MFCHDATQKQDIVSPTLQLCSYRQSQWRKLPVRISVERLNVLLLVLEHFLCNTSKCLSDIDCFFSKEDQKSCLDMVNNSKDH